MSANNNHEVGKSQPGCDGPVAATETPAPSAADRVTKALDMACRYSGGITHGDGSNAETLLWGDIRDVIEQHGAMLSALTKLADECEAEFTMDGKWVNDGQLVKRRTYDAARAATAKALGQPTGGDQ